QEGRRCGDATPSAPAPAPCHARTKANATPPSLVAPGATLHLARLAAPAPPRGSSMFSEQRRHRRVSLRTRIDVDSASNFYTGFVENISSGGLFISSRELREIGEIVRIRFTLPDAGPPIEADAI